MEVDGINVVFGQPEEGKVASLGDVIKTHDGRFVHVAGTTPLGASMAAVRIYYPAIPSQGTVRGYQIAAVFVPAERVDEATKPLHAAIEGLKDEIARLTVLARDQADKLKTAEEVRAAISEAHAVLDSAGIRPAGRCDDRDCKTKLGHRVRDMALRLKIAEERNRTPGAEPDIKAFTSAALADARRLKAAEKLVDDLVKRLHQECAARLDAELARLRAQIDAVRSVNWPPCGKCGAPSTSAACNLIEMPLSAGESVKRFEVGPKRYGCDHHPVESVVVRG